MSTVQLWWIDVPIEGLASSVNYRSTLGLLLDHTRSHRSDSTLVVIVRRDHSGVRSQPSRLARGAQFRHTLRPCNRTVHCTCQYGFEPHYRIDFYTRHVAVQNTPCKHASSPDSPATEAMLASMVEQWSAHHLSHLQLAPATCVEQSYVLEPSASLLYCKFLGVKAEKRPQEVIHPELFPLKCCTRLSDSEELFWAQELTRRAQRPPDSPFLVDGT